MTNFEHIKSLSFTDMAAILDDFEHCGGRGFGEKWVDWLAKEYNPHLVKCPFCGKTDTLILGDSDFINDDDDHNSFAVCCDYHNGGCGACGGFAETEEEAITKWNVRAE